MRTRWDISTSCPDEVRHDTAPGNVEGSTYYRYCRHRWDLRTNEHMRLIQFLLRCRDGPPRRSLANHEDGVSSQPMKRRNSMVYTVCTAARVRSPPIHFTPARLIRLTCFASQEKPMGWGDYGGMEYDLAALGPSKLALKPSGTYSALILFTLRMYIQYRSSNRKSLSIDREYIEGWLAQSTLPPCRVLSRSVLCATFPTCSL
jgi:hypothetical protein